MRDDFDYAATVVELGNLPGGKKDAFSERCATSGVLARV